MKKPISTSLQKEWNYSLNSHLDINKLSSGSAIEAIWICEKGHEYPMPIYKRTQGRGCPYCSNTKILAGFNDLATTHPELAEQFDLELNDGITPSEIFYGTKKQFFWKTNCNHTWKVNPSRRAQAKNNCPTCFKNIPNGKSLALRKDLLEEYAYDLNVLRPEEISLNSSLSVWWRCKEKEHVWEAVVYSRTGTSNAKCKRCSGSSPVSEAEVLITEYIKSIEPSEVLSSNRSVIGKELDIYIPNKKIAIEYNGLYWHAEKQGKDKTYHYNKWLACKEKGIQLIQIWEDEWINNPELIKRMLKVKLGLLTNEPKIFGRQTFVKQIAAEDARLFLNEYHIQGYASGKYYLGLFSKVEEKLVAVLVLRVETSSENSLLISRYATSLKVVGGFTKMLSYILKTFSPNKLVTFSDNNISKGDLYNKSGFISDKILPPDYMYVVGKQRIHKFNYRLKRFRDDPDLLFDETKTERELAILNNIDRVWDSGKVRWVYQNN